MHPLELVAIGCSAGNGLDAGDTGNATMHGVDPGDAVRVTRWWLMFAAVPILHNEGSMGHGLRRYHDRADGSAG